jgi:hypothetical protein
MPSWWLQWAERLAVIFAEWWLRSRPGATGGGADTPQADRPAEPHPDATVPHSPRSGTSPPR